MRGRIGMRMTMVAALLSSTAIAQAEDVEVLSKMRVAGEADVQSFEETRKEPAQVFFSHPDAAKAEGGDADPSDESVKAIPIVHGPKVGRNQPCPCGSGKKYKQCCGRLS